MPGKPPPAGWDVLHIPKIGDVVDPKDIINPTTACNTGCCISRDPKGNVKTTMPDTDCCNNVSCGGAEKKTGSCQSCSKGSDLANTKCALGEMVWCTALCPVGHPKYVAPPGVSPVIGACYCVDPIAKTFQDSTGWSI